MEKFRTIAQYQVIVDDVLNANWKDAAKGCVDGGFFASDLISMHKDARDEMLFYTDELGDLCMANPFEEETDIAVLIELATNLRNK